MLWQRSAIGLSHIPERASTAPNQRLQATTTDPFGSLGVPHKIKGVRNEWHLLNLRRMTIFADVLSGDRTWFGEQRVGFWPSLDGPGLETSRPVAYPLLSDQNHQAIYRCVFSR